MTIESVRGWIPLTGLSIPCWCVCPMPEPTFLSVYVVVIYCPTCI